MQINNNDEIVYVPIPRHLLSAFYRLFPTIIAEESDLGAAKTSLPITDKRNLNVIHLSISAAREIGADHRPISLADLHSAYLHANPGIGKGTTRNSFDATIIYHTINMRARFPDPLHKNKPASWLSRPVFKRVARARYMLLSPKEISLFQRLVEEDDPRIYADEFDIDDLT